MQFDSVFEYSRWHEKALCFMSAVVKPILAFVHASVNIHMHFDVCNYECINSLRAARKLTIFSTRTGFEISNRIKAWHFAVKFREKLWVDVSVFSNGHVEFDF